MPPLALAVATATITVLNGTFTFALHVIRLMEVDDDLKICLKLLATATRDLNYARQLRSNKFTLHQNESDHVDISYIK